MIGFIGLGVMGEPICRNLATKSEEKLLGFDLDSAPLARLKGQGVEAAASVHEIAERCDMVFLSLPGVPEVKMVCAGLLLDARSGSDVIDLSTTTVALARDLNSRFAARGVHFADAPIARTREAAEKGTLSVMVGSSEQVFNRIRPTLAHIATDITHCGGPGAGQATKLINNMVLFENVVALAEALALARRAGLNATRVFETLAKGSADSFALRHHGLKAMIPDNYPERAFSVEYALKDLEYALEFAVQARAELPGARNAKALLERAAAAGLGKKYFPVLAKIL
jgi:3-hydroxyisobutyrate dehydrogenase-like beta-hydroxyacid dehydrogenase